MLVRVRCRTGTHRIEIEPSADISVLVDKICQAVPEADRASLTMSNQPRGGETAVATLAGPLTTFGLSHGDLLFVSWKAAAEPTPAPTAAATAANGAAEASTSTAPPITSKAWQSVVEDPIDAFWEKADGKIARPRDAKMCKHGDKAMCDYCMPIEPYDANYQKEKKIKHLSFHAYLRKLDTQTNKGSASASSFVPPLSEPDYRVTVPCPSGSHAPWPGGICSKCQPSAITLQLQQYRMVDHVEFATPDIVDRFLNFWRQRGAQRFGYLIGRYETYDQVPMGIKAVVEAIHEPPQAGEIDGVEVGMPWEDEVRVGRLAEACGMRVVGVIYTDLVADKSDGAAPGQVVCKRHAGSFFLSSLEVLFAARMQLARPNPSRFCATGRFSSKFVTCVVTGNEKGEIEVQAYQASDQAMAMAQADIAEPSVDPAVVRIRPDASAGGEGPRRYIPDVFYRYRNQYNLEVKESAKPCFPVDYLLVSLTHGFPEKPKPAFVGGNGVESFAIENRQGWQDQTNDQVFAKASRVLGSDADLARWLSDWHLLVFLDSIGVLGPSDMAVVARVAASAAEPGPAIHELRESASWQTFATIAAESAPAATSGARPGSAMDDAMDADVGGGAAAGGMVACPHCTFENPVGQGDCDVCGLPLR